MAFSRRILISSLAVDGYFKRMVDEKGKNDILENSTDGLFKEYDLTGWLTGKTSYETFFRPGNDSKEILYYEVIKTKAHDPKFTKIYCTCGYTGTAEQIGENTDASFYSHSDLLPIYACPSCHCEPEIIIPKWMSEAKPVIEYVDIFDHRNKENRKQTISLNWAITSYFFNKESEKLAAKNERYRLTVNIETGMAYLFTPDKKLKIRNITYGFMSMSIRKQLFTFSHNTSEIHEKVIKKFIDLLLEARNIQYKSYHEITHSYNKEKANFNLIWNVLPYIRFPQLQNIPAYNWSMIPKRLRKKLNNTSQSAVDVYQALIGIGSKKIRELDEEYECMSLLVFWSLFIKKQDNFIKLVHAFSNTDEYIDPNNIFENTFYGQVGIDAMKFVYHLHRDENTFVRSLLKLEDSARIHCVFELLHYIKDIKNMYDALHARIDNYEIKYKNDLEEYHQKLSRDYARIKDEETDIIYSKNELSLYENKINEYRFELAKTNHELVDVGSKMSICVGSYAERAIERKTTIVFMKKDEVEICIELNKINKKMQIIQAKAKSNGKPNTEQAIIIKKWCKEAGILTKSCHDLNVSLQTL
jgi:hypothetical protein